MEIKIKLGRIIIDIPQSNAFALCAYKTIKKDYPTVFKNIIIPINDLAELHWNWRLNHTEVFTFQLKEFLY